MSKNNWSIEETIIAFNLYCKMPFGSINKTNFEIVKLSQLINRTPSSVAMKMCNLANYDPELQRRGVKGLSNCSKLDKVVWEQFQSDWELLAQKANDIVNSLSSKNIICNTMFDGDERDAIVSKRIGQIFFRQAVLNAYENKCCITGIAIPELLIASHIKPWVACDVKTERANPSNGLALNSLHDKAFDKGLISISKEYKILISNKLKLKSLDNKTKEWITSYEGKLINLPHKFLPDKKFIEYHNDVIFEK